MVDTMVRRDVVRAPAWPAFTAAVMAVMALTLALVSWYVLEVPSLALLGAGYLLGAVATIVFACVYRAMRLRRRPDPQFRPQPWLDRVAPAALVLGVAAGLLNAFLLATELAK